jgi:hypothetical protein
MESPKMKFPKIVATVAILVALGGGALGYAYTQSDDYNKSRVTVTASYDISRCGWDEPIRLVIENAGNKVVQAVRVEVDARRPGRSTRIYSVNLSSDYYVHPSETLVKCYETHTRARNRDDIYQRENTFEWSLKEVSYVGLE